MTRPKPLPTPPAFGPAVEHNAAPAICGACKGRCCKAAPGSYHPDQFGPDLEGLRPMLEAHAVSIDWRPDDGEDVYFVRPRTVGAPRTVYHGANGEDTCINLQKTGCSLTWGNRPYDCRRLIPVPSFECGDGVDPFGLRPWVVHQERLLAIGDALARERQEADHTAAAVDGMGASAFDDDSYSFVALFAALLLGDED